MYNIEQWEYKWIKGLKFTFCYNLKEIIMMYFWYLSLEKLPKMYKSTSNNGRVTKPKNWIQMHTLIQKILKINIQLNPDLFLLGLMDKREKVQL